MFIGFFNSKSCNYSPPLVIASVAKQSHLAATSSYNTKPLKKNEMNFVSVLWLAVWYNLPIMDKQFNTIEIITYYHYLYVSLQKRNI